MKKILHDETHQSAAIQSVSFGMAVKLAEKIKSSPIVGMHAVFTRLHVSIITSAFLDDDFGFFCDELYPLLGQESGSPKGSREEILESF